MKQKYASITVLRKRSQVYRCLPCVWTRTKQPLWATPTLFLQAQMTLFDDYLQSFLSLSSLCFSDFISFIIWYCSFWVYLYALSHLPFVWFHLCSRSATIYHTHQTLHISIRMRKNQMHVINIWNTVIILSLRSVRYTFGNQLLKFKGFHFRNHHSTRHIILEGFMMIRMNDITFVMEIHFVITLMTNHILTQSRIQKSNHITRYIVYPFNWFVRQWSSFRLWFQHSSQA